MQDKRSSGDIDTLREKLASLIKRKAPKPVIDAAKKKLKSMEERES